MTASAKISEVGVPAGGGLHGAPLIPPAENLVSAAVSNASRPVDAIVSSHNGVADGEVVAPVQRPSWELGDSEFSSYEEELILRKSDPLPRVVFGGVSTMKEPEEATSELKDVLDKVYLKSPNSTSSEGSLILGPEPGLPILLSNSEFAEAKACVSSETASSEHVLHAFKFISETPAAQSLVASVYHDSNVWNAVRQNPEYIKYFQSHMTAAAPSTEIDLNVNQSAADGNLQEQDPIDAQKPFEDSQPANLGTRFTSFLENVKCKAVDRFSNFSSFVQDTVVGTAEKKSVDADGGGGVTFMDTTALGSSIMGLALCVIMFVVLKRV